MGKADKESYSLAAAILAHGLEGVQVTEPATVGGKAEAKIRTGKAIPRLLKSLLG